jgi:hypothetical protein
LASPWPIAKIPKQYENPIGYFLPLLILLYQSFSVSALLTFEASSFLVVGLSYALYGVSIIPGLYSELLPS